MTGALLLSACSRARRDNVKTPDTVPDTAPFYEGHKLILADEYKNSKEYDYSYVSPKCFDEEYIAVYISAEKKSSDGGYTIRKAFCRGKMLRRRLLFLKTI